MTSTYGFCSFVLKNSNGMGSNIKVWSAYTSIVLLLKSGLLPVNGVVTPVMIEHVFTSPLSPEVLIMNEMPFSQYLYL